MSTCINCKFQKQQMKNHENPTNTSKNVHPRTGANIFKTKIVHIDTHKSHIPLKSKYQGHLNNFFAQNYANSQTHIHKKHKNQYIYTSFTLKKK